MRKIAAGRICSLNRISRLAVNGRRRHVARHNSNRELLGHLKQQWYSIYKVVIDMETKDVIFELRAKNGLSQEELAEKIYVTRQAVSRWENGEIVPNTETLKLLSKLFDVSINTLLGAPRKLICQCCGMPLDDCSISREIDGTFNEEYCKWCYTDGKFVYTSLAQLTDFLVGHMSNENWPPAQARAFFEAELPKLRYWQQSKE
ncbi:MAG: zinc ribbon domain-containing protein [Eubacteriales bacterium]|nr:zinc ribbon domain-containing protein [Eubacteriales bacterium]